MNSITNIFDLLNGYVFVEGFVFMALTAPPNVYDAIVIRNPGGADCLTPETGRSTRSLDEHIAYIKENGIKKAVIIAESIDFISACPGIECVEIIPADTVSGDFDCSPLYEMPRLTWMKCSDHPCRIDFSKLPGLEHLYLEAPDSLFGFEHLTRLKTLNISEYKGDLSDLIFSRELEELEMIRCKAQTLSGIAFSDSLSSLYLGHSRQLYDISGLKGISKTLRSLSIESCPKIADFSVLNELTELEHLELLGNNTVPDLSFLSKMSNLKTFSFSVNVLNGDLSYCLRLPYACCLKGRKHYNMKDKDLPHNI